MLIQQVIQSCLQSLINLNNTWEILPILKLLDAGSEFLFLLKDLMNYDFQIHILL